MTTSREHGVSQVDAPKSFHEGDILRGLVAKSFDCVRVVKLSVFTQHSVDPRKEHSFRKNVGVAVAKHALQLLYSPKRTPDTCRQADISHRTPFKTVGKLEMIDEQLQDPGKGPVVFRCYDHQAACLQHAHLEWSEAGRFLGIGSRQEKLRRQFLKIEQMRRDPEIPINLDEKVGDFQCV